jgi:hypothetical protein
LIKGLGRDRIKVSRFSPGKDDRHEECSTLVDDVIRSIVKLGGSYADVMQAIQDAKSKDYLLARVEVDAVPTDREFDSPSREEHDSPAPRARVQSANPLPELFQSPHTDASDQDKEATESPATTPEKPKPGFFGRMTGWFRD